MNTTNGQTNETTTPAALDREQLERWIETGQRVFVVFRTGVGERVALACRIMRLDSTGITFDLGREVRGRTVGARLDRIEVLRAAGGAQ